MGKFENLNRSQTAETTLDLLGALAEDETMSQRGLATRLGVALGLTNAVLKRCIRKGLLKIKQAPTRRYAYYLTPKGFAEKSRLTAEYLSYSLQFYRTARQEFSDLARVCEEKGWQRIVLIGATELSEIATLAVADAEIEVVGILDQGTNQATFCGLPIYRSLDAMEMANRPNAVIITDMTDPQGAYDQLVQFLPHERVLAPKLSRVTVNNSTADSRAE